MNLGIFYVVIQYTPQTWKKSLIFFLGVLLCKMSTSFITWKIIIT